MRQKIILLLMCIFFAGTVYAQQKRTCEAMEDLEYRKRQDPTLQKRMDAIERFTQRKIQEKKKAKRKISGSIITIPVVVHVLYTNATNNISDAQILSQIDVLNKDFRRTNTDKTNKWTQAADTEIEFAMAKIDPSGNSTEAITRKLVSDSDWGTKFKARNAMKSVATGGIDPWDTSEYLNMWIVPKMTSTGPRGDRNILGFAQFPGGAAATDGLVMIHDAFGTVGTLNPSFNLGRTTTHEIGHYLNLRHIWGDGPCGVDDFVSDTPESDAPNYSCNTGHTSCGSEDMVQNYMDYSDDACMNLFTLGQKNRMRAVLEVGGFRRSLALSDKFGSEESVCKTIVPKGVSTSGVSETGATVKWTAVSGATYDVRYRKVGTSSWTTKQSSSASVILTGLSDSTKYQVQVRSKCSSGYSKYSFSVNFSTNLGVKATYCASKGNSVAYEWIDYVSFGGMTNTTSRNGGYGDFTSKVATVAQGSTNQLVVSAGFRSSAYNEYFTIWIDYNKNGIFESREKVASGNSKSSGKISSNITIPSSASLGQTRMRVSMKYNAASTPCETFTEGEVEDYTVNITANTSKGTSISNIDALRDEIGLDLMVYPNPVINFIEINVASKSDNITYNVVNTIGSVVKSGKMMSRTLDVSNLKSGMYMIEVNDGQKLLKTKFIKK
ncbi:GEVED domain-containing protein [Tenacibaculum sp. nBUS_03]|uniref:GEVED domain-containing protein n=1 Tax=Tenacibaculum sp. nBUS_03 TaxID=3395320 RepID=UPI003EBC5CF5